MNFNLGDSNLLSLLALHRIANLAQEDSEEGRIRDITDEEGRPHTKASYGSSSIEQLFQLGEKSSEYMDDSKYEEAYGIVKKQYKLGARVNFASTLVRYYVTLMHTNRAEKACKIFDELYSLMQDNTEATPANVVQYAEALRKEDKYFESILFYKIALRVASPNEANASEVINSLQKCSLGTKLAVSELLEKHLTTKQIIKNYVIPDMHKMEERIGKIRSVDKKQTCVIQAICIHHVEHCEYLVDDQKSREKSLKTAIELLCGVLGKDADKHQIYGASLNNLGHTYLIADRPREAAEMFSKAIAAKQNAEDYGTESEKQKELETCKMALKLARNNI